MKIRELKRNTKLAMENLENQSWEASVLYGGINVYRDVMKIHRSGWFWWKVCRKKPKFTKHCQLFLRLIILGANYMIEIIANIDVAYVTLMYEIT